MFTPAEDSATGRANEAVAAQAPKRGSQTELGAIHWILPACEPLVMIWLTMLTGQMMSGRFVDTPVNSEEEPAGIPVPAIGAPATTFSGFPDCTETIPPKRHPSTSR